MKQNWNAKKNALATTPREGPPRTEKELYAEKAEEFARALRVTAGEFYRKFLSLADPRTWVRSHPLPSIVVSATIGFVAAGKWEKTLTDKPREFSRPINREGKKSGQPPVASLLIAAGFEFLRKALIPLAAKRMQHEKE